MTTAAQLGFTTPTGDELVNTGDNAITQNANASAVMYDALHSYATTQATKAKNDSIADATTKYGGLPQRMADAESKNTEQDNRLALIDSDLALIDSDLSEIFATTQAIDAPAGFDADSVNGQAVHMVNGLDEALNMPGTGSWTLLTYPNTSDGAALQQIAVRYSVSGAELWSRVKTSGGWAAWIRLDANKWIDRLDALDLKNTDQDNRLTSVESKNTDQDNRLDYLDTIQAIKSVRFENGKWVWDTTGATHYVLIDHDGKPAVRATQWPQPSPTSPEFTW